MTQVPFSLSKTPDEWHHHPIRIRPNIPSLTKHSFHLLKLTRPYTKPSITTKTVRDNALSSLQSPQSAPPTPYEGNTGQLSDLSCSPSLKTQKKQYLKLFTTASTNRQESVNEENSNRSICGSSSAAIKQQLPSYKGQNIDSPQGELTDRVKSPPRRRLFSDLGIQNQQKIIMEQSNAEPQMNSQQFIMSMPRLAPSSLSQIPYKTEEGEDAAQLFQICSGCFKFLPTQNIHLHQENCFKFQIFLRMNPKEQFAFIRSVGLQLMHRIEQQAGGLQSGDLVSLVGHCNAFLKECELAWSTGRPSQIYNFKLKELQLSSSNLIRCVQDIHRLNFLLSLQQNHATQLSPLIQ